MCVRPQSHVHVAPLNTYTFLKRAGAPRIARRSTCPPRSSRLATPRQPRSVPHMHNTHTTDSAGLHRQTLTARANNSTGHEQAKKESSTVEKRQTRRAQTPRSRRALSPCRARTPRPRPWAYRGHVAPPWRRSAASAAGAYAPARFGCLSFLRLPLLRPAAEAPASSEPGVWPGDLSAPTCAASRLPAPPIFKRLP